MTGTREIQCVATYLTGAVLSYSPPICRRRLARSDEVLQRDCHAALLDAAISRGVNHQAAADAVEAAFDLRAEAIKDGDGGKGRTG